jgi:hypothetical protein
MLETETQAIKAQHALEGAGGEELVEHVARIGVYEINAEFCS